MKPIDYGDLLPGNKLLCVFDYTKRINWTGHVVSVLDNRASMVQLYCDDREEHWTTNQYDVVELHHRIIFVNYDKMTDKEKFLYHLSGRVNLE